jgi:putative endonuclease
VREFYVYILASRPGGAIYVGVTNDLVRRVYEHKQGFVRVHTKTYRIDKLVYFEQFVTARDAIQREKNMKRWPRAYKTRLIAQSNPEWRDLFDKIAI